MGTVLHLRSESKPLEYRSALTPTTSKALTDAGYTVNVERSTGRIFKDEDFAKAGATLVPEGSWTSVPADHIIIGLKELPEDDFPLKHTHVHFAHCYKQQDGWQQVLSRFPREAGLLLDLEFLTDETGRRVAAFGYHAGYAGAALAIEAWAFQLTNPSEKMRGVKPFANQDLLLDNIRTKMAAGEKVTGRKPRVLVIGALGRCGRGAVDICRAVGIPEDQILKWDMAETEKGGPFSEIIKSDVFVNCIYLSQQIAPFVDARSLASPERQLSVVCDVSCDTSNPHNPIPIYDINTTFDSPLVGVKTEGDPKLSVISIDHLPSLMPRESSEAFSQALLPSLLELKDRKSSRVWKQAEALFDEKVATLPESGRNVNGATK